MKKFYLQFVFAGLLVVLCVLPTLVLAQWNNTQESIRGDVSTDNITWASAIELAPKSTRSNNPSAEGINTSFVSRALDISAGIKPIFHLYGSSLINTLSTHGPAYMRQLIALSYNAAVPESTDADLYTSGGFKIEALAADPGSLAPACVNDFGRLMHCPQ